MFRVKICGITSAVDAQAAVEAGADAIGLNFYSASPRACDFKTAGKIVAALPANICKVGVFVNATAAEIRNTVEQIGLDVVQLHGDEPPELLHDVRPLAIIRAFRVASDFSPIGEYLRACHVLRCVPRMLMIDAHKQGQYGGTGQTLDWSAVAKNRQHFCGTPLVLAGGLNPKNVAAAIAAARPWAVDTASGVEVSPGRKSPELMRAFVAEARAALAAAAKK
jgi:phosphoribosylanthranilate isomerase